MKELQEHLRPGETLQWKGKPRPFRLLEEGCKNKIICKWILTFACGALLLGLYLGANPVPSTAFITLVVGVMAVVAVSPVLEAHSLRKQQYFITDQRAIVVTGDKGFYYMELSEVNDVEPIDGCSAFRSVAMGRAIMGEVSRQLRWQAKNPKIDVQSSQGNEHAIGMVFYDTEDVDGALLLLKEDKKTVPSSTPSYRAAS